MSEKIYQDQEAELLIALNARRSAEAVFSFRKRNPESPVMIVLTGTDINHADASDEKSDTWQALEMADRLVILHEASMAAVPELFREKCQVIYPSVVLPDDLHHTPAEPFNILIAGNLRPEKNPQLAIAAARLIEHRIDGYGCLKGYEKLLESVPQNFHWHGAVAHDDLLKEMARSSVLLNTSTQEGGANAICEAISMGLPVVASAIPGNIGMLGEDYVGLFSADDAIALAEILNRCASDVAFYSQLKQQISDRTPLFSYQREADSWLALLSSLTK